MGILHRVGVLVLLLSFVVVPSLGCENLEGPIAAYLMYDLISGGPIFGGDGGDDDDNGDENHAPQIVSIQALPSEVSIGGSITLSTIASDEDGDELTYLWQATKGQFSDPTATVTLWTAPTDFTGTFQITLTVSDDKDARDIDFVEVRVTL